MPDTSLHTQTIEFVEIIRRFSRLRAHLNVVQPEDLTKIMTLLDETNPTGRAATKGDYKMLFSVGMILVDEGPLTMGELGHILDVPLSTATRMVDWLVATGYVERIHHAEDRRIVNVGLTDAGRHMLRIQNEYLRLRIEKLLKHFNRMERQSLLVLMRKLASAIEEE